MNTVKFRTKNLRGRYSSYSDTLKPEDGRPDLSLVAFASLFLVEY